MNSFSINTLGCKVNQYESEQIRQFLQELGLVQVEITDKPDLVIVNTCCVTASASAKSRQRIRKAQRLNPDAMIIVIGCLATAEIGEMPNLGKNTYVITHRNNLAATLIQIINSKTTFNTQELQAHKGPIKGKELLYNSSIQPKLPLLTSFEGHTRAFLKIQDGCNGHCAYCIIPKTRPFVQSKSSQAVLHEAEALVKAGHKEIVLTGVFLGAYGQSTVRRENWPNQTNNQLALLLDKIANIPGLARIRLSSLEPADITDQLLDIFCKHPNIMPHLHLSLQSGSNTILKKMHRQYTADQFREKIELIKSRLDRPAITADILVGFPGETDADFQETVELAKEAGFAKMHVFCFSPRKGTVAANMQGKIDNKIIKERSKILRDLGDELAAKFRQQFVGETAEILLESDGYQPYGRSERYFMVYVEKAEKKLAKNELVRVKLIKNNKNAMIGKIEG